MKKGKYVVWVYARRDTSHPAKVAALAENLLKKAEAHGWTVAGVSQDMCQGFELHRPGLKEVSRAVRSGLANVVLVENLDQIGANNRIRCRFLKMLQDHGAILMSSGTDLRYELSVAGLETVLMKRAARKCCGMPW